MSEAAGRTRAAAGRLARARRIVAAAALCAAITLALLARVAGAAGDASFDRVSARFLDEWLERRPQLATRLGIHRWDSRLRAITPQTVASDLAWLRGLGAELDSIPESSLSFDRAIDAGLLRARLERERVELEEVQSWRRNPSVYLDMVAGGVQALLQRDFASPCARAQLAARRLAQVPEVLRAARIQIDNPPRVATEVAISQFEGALRFYRETVPALTANCHDPQVQAELAESDTAAVRAVEVFLRALREEILPRSNGEFALGPALYAKKLAADEMETQPADSLLARGWRALEETDARMRVVAERIAPGLGVRAALDTLARAHPDASGLLSAVDGQLNDIRAFVIGHGLLTPPERENLIVREAPVWRRSLSFASMDGPGVWEEKATQAYYNVTPPDSSWDEARRNDHLAFFNRYGAAFVSIHEALPGHYWQGLALRGVHSRLRQALGSGSASEGWAHYCEQMMLEQGFGGGDPRYELAQLSAALQRIGRLIVGISLHTRGMTYEEAEKLFEERCYMAPVNAAREAKRGTSDPTYLVYTLGKWRILDLREEARARLGARFSLRDFHDALLRQGGMPMPLARRAVLRELGVPDPGDATAR